MAARRKVRGRETQLAFEALAIEGGLLSADWLGRVAQLQAGAQSEAEYRIPKGLNLRDEIGRYWRIAQPNWTDFARGRSAGGDGRALAEQFVHALLKGSFGFESLEKVGDIAVADRNYPVGAIALGARVPVVVGPAGSGVDAPSSAFGDGTRRRSAFGLAQEFLNASDGALWAIASDGLVLRILRDNASLTRPAWIEADLGRIFAEERYADFAALWLLVHESRFGAKDRPPSDCALETWRNAGREEGTRAREQLRNGVEEALLALGQGFLAHPENGHLRVSLESGALTKDRFFQELLRLVYRVIFLLTAEERGVLHAPSALDLAKKLYSDGYGMRRLRDRSVRRNAYDRFGDLWEAMKIALRALSRGEARLGLPALGGLFDEDQCPHVDDAKLENRALLHAVFRLSWLRDDGSLSRVNWRDMGPEELGSVYESLLELVPMISQSGHAFSFATGSETKGNARKTTGSYYTPDSLVQVLLDSALEPIIEAAVAANPEHPVDALLNLSIVDPACGSGHFLLSAARRLAAHVARLQAMGTPSAEQYRHALRQVVGRCIFGVDLNPMAVELCKVSLWMEAVEPGLPLSFLDSHIQNGNALFGATPELMVKGIPDEAWEAIEGDDRKIASALKKQNKKERVEVTLDFNTTSPASTYARLGAGALAVDHAADESLAAVQSKEQRWVELVASSAYDRARFLADLWCAAFVWAKQPGPLRDIAPTHGAFRTIQKDSSCAPRRLRDEVERIREQYRFFHWHLAFPQVNARGGFDLVLGNPPWERVKLEEQEFFASRSTAIAKAENASERKKLVSKLPEENPILWRDLCDARRASDALSHFVRQSARYPLCGQGDVNTYALFAEHNRSLLSQRARAGFLCPSGLATDETTMGFFQSLVSRRELTSILHFENEEKVFPGVHHTFRFLLLCLDGSGSSATIKLVFFARRVSELSSPERQFVLTPADFATLNPNTKTCPTFRSRRDAELNLAMYRRAGVLWRDDDDVNGNPWGIRFMRMFDMANDSEIFKTRTVLQASDCALVGNRFVGADGSQFVPLVEGRMVDMFDHRYSNIEAEAERTKMRSASSGFLSDIQKEEPQAVPLPRSWVAAGQVDSRLRDRWHRSWMLGWRDITMSTVQRTVIASIIPRFAVGDTFLLAMPSVNPGAVAALYANLCSFALDYAARQKVGGTHLKYHTFKQLPVLAPSAYEVPAPWGLKALLRDWILSRVVELAYTAWDLEPFARDVGYEGPPFIWARERRFLLRCELDAAFFHLYGFSRDDADHVMDTFPIVRRNEEKAHGEYRTKRVILEIYDAMAMAVRSGEPYVTRLDPPAADPRVAHPPRAAERATKRG